MTNANMIVDFLIFFAGLAIGIGGTIYYGLTWALGIIDEGLADQRKARELYNKANLRMKRTDALIKQLDRMLAEYQVLVNKGLEEGDKGLEAVEAEK